VACLLHYSCACVRASLPARAFLWLGPRVLFMHVVVIFHVLLIKDFMGPVRTTVWRQLSVYVHVMFCCTLLFFF